MIHEMRLNNEPFNKIKEGTKTVELRLLDEKRKTLRVGDKIIFTNRANNEKIDVLVTNLFKADSFAPIYEKYSKVAIGYNEEDDAKPEDMEEYYSKEEIKKYGCIAIEIEKVLNDNCCGGANWCW